MFEVIQKLLLVAHFCRQAVHLRARVRVAKQIDDCAEAERQDHSVGTHPQSAVTPECCLRCCRGLASLGEVEEQLSREERVGHVAGREAQEANRAEGDQHSK